MTHHRRIFHRQNAAPLLDKTQNNKSEKCFADTIPEDELMPNLLFISVPSSLCDAGLLTFKAILLRTR
jgi:hypothetical protein